MAVSIQQAAQNAFATWLTAQPTMAGVNVESKWVANGKDFPGPNGKVISVITAGPRKDTPIDIILLKATNSGATQTNAVWQTHASFQPLQLDVWATRQVERDDILAKLDDLLSTGTSPVDTYNPDPVGHGVLLNVLNGFEEFETKADFYFDDPDLDDSSDSMERGIFRATYRGGVHFMLCVRRTSPRQKLIRLSLYLNGVTTAQDTEIT